MILIKNSQERSRFIKFAIVGTIGFGVDFLVFNLFRSVIGFEPIPSSIFSFIAAISSNFIWHRYWTFPESRNKKITSQLSQYAFVNTIGWLIRTTILAIIILPMVKFAESIDIQIFLSPKFIGENLSLAIVVITVMFWNYFINRYWTYNDID